MELVLAILSIFSNYGIINMTYENLNKMIKKKKILQTLLSCDNHCQHFDKQPLNIPAHSSHTLHTHAQCMHPHKPFMHTQSHTPGTNMQIVHTMIHTHTQWMYAHTMHTHIICTLKQGSTLYSCAHCMHILHTHITCTHYVYTHNTHTHIDLRNRLTLKSTFIICFFNSTTC